MKKLTSLFLFFFLIAFTCYSLAGTTTLTTFYPPPTAAYNKVALSTNYVAFYSGAAPGSYCTATNMGALFVYTGTKNIEECTALDTTESFCSDPTYYGSLVADNTGTLHACIFSAATSSYQDTIYPQQCYNAFCSTDTYYNVTSCPPKCAAGFILKPVNSSAGPASYYDTFQTNVDDTVSSYVCCNSP